MLEKKVEQALNAQINMELAASYSYLAMAVYLDTLHLTGFSSWMEKQSDEERAHGQPVGLAAGRRQSCIGFDILAPELEFRRTEAGDACKVKFAYRFLAYSPQRDKVSAGIGTSTLVLADVGDGGRFKIIGEIGAVKCRGLRKFARSRC